MSIWEAEEWAGAWWGAEGTPRVRGAQPASQSVRGEGCVFTCASSPSSSLQGPLPQLPALDVMADPALSWHLSLLTLLLPLAIPQASAVMNGEDLAAEQLCFPLGRRPAPF